MPCRRQNAVSAGYDNAAPSAVSSSWTRTRFPLQETQQIQDLLAVGFGFLRSFPQPRIVHPVQMFSDLHRILAADESHGW